MVRRAEVEPARWDQDPDAGVVQTKMEAGVGRYRKIRHATGGLTRDEAAIIAFVASLVPVRSGAGRGTDHAGAVHLHSGHLSGCDTSSYGLENERIDEQGGKDATVQSARKDAPQMCHDGKRWQRSRRLSRAV